MHSLVPLRADARGLVVLWAVGVRRVVECAVAPAQWPPPPLVLEVPVEAGEGAVLLALVLKEQRALVHAELLQVSEIQKIIIIYLGNRVCVSILLKKPYCNFCGILFYFFILGTTKKQRDFVSCSRPNQHLFISPLSFLPHLFFTHYF